MTAVDPPLATAENGRVMLVVRLDTRDGAQRQMSDALTRLTDATRREDRGVIGFEVGLDPLDDTRVVGYEIWESKTHWPSTWQRHTQDVQARVRDLVIDPNEPLRAEHWQPLRPETPAHTPRRSTRFARPPPRRRGFAASVARSATSTCTT
jgi:quinol monooxygenase YgiN